MTWLRARKRRKKVASSRHQLIWGVVTLVVLAVLAYGVWYGTHHESFAVTEVTVSGGATVSHTKVTDAVWQALEGNQYLIVSKKFAYLYPHDAVRERVSAIPRVHDVTITRTGRTLAIHFEEHVPYALWCNGRAAGDSCVFLTKDGFGFDNAPQLKGSTFVRYVTETASSTPDTRALSKDVMERIASFNSALKERFNFKVASVVSTIDGDEIFYLTTGSALMISPEEGLEASLEKLQSVLASEEFTHLLTEPFNYIDLRFGNRVFVKEE